MPNYMQVYNLQMVNYNVYWPIISHLYCVTSAALLTLPKCNVGTSTLSHDHDSLDLQLIQNGHKAQTNLLEAREVVG